MGTGGERRCCTKRGNPEEAASEAADAAEAAPAPAAAAAESESATGSPAADAAAEAEEAESAAEESNSTLSAVASSTRRIWHVPLLHEPKARRSGLLRSTSAPHKHAKDQHEQHRT